MKKTIITIIIVILMTNYIKAQDNSGVQENKTDFRKTAFFGIKAGANYSNLYDTKSEEFNAGGKYGLAAGIFVPIPILGKLIGIQPEILFSQKGYQTSGNLLGSPYKFTRTSDFIDVPLFVSLKPSEFVTLLAGPQFSYLLYQTDEFTSSNITKTQEKEFKNDNIRKNIMCFICGFDVTLSHLVLGARAGWDLQDNNGDGTSTNPRYKNVWYQATIGLRF